MGKGCGCCDDFRTKHKDFRQDKGGGPEVAKHVKKKVKKRVRHKDDHRHVYVMEIRNELDYWWWRTGDYYVAIWACAEFGCEKVKKTRYIGTEKALDKFRKAMVG